MKSNIRNKNIDELTGKEKALYFFGFFTRSIFYSVCGVFVIGLFLFAIYYIDLVLNVKSGNNTVPLFGSYVIVSQSMVPTINVNDVVIVKRSDKSEIEVGDIITFASSDVRIKDLTITHRIVGTERDEVGNTVYRTRGDNNNFDDSAYVNLQSIYGKVICKLPQLGVIQNIISTPLGSLFGIVIAFILILVAFIFKPKIMSKV